MDILPTSKLKLQVAPESVEQAIYLMATANVKTLHPSGEEHFYSIYKRNRSLMDTFSVVLYHFPETTEDGFLNAVAKLLLDERIESQYCQDIKAQIIKARVCPQVSFYVSYPKDEYGIAGDNPITEQLRAICNKNTEK